MFATPLSGEWSPSLTTTVARPRGCACCSRPARRWSRRRIHPFSESGDDDPRNGIALTPNMHWAFDHNLIAPSPDFCWRVSDQLDARIPDYRELRDLDGKRLFLPSEPRLYPKREVLEWRVARLRDSGWTSTTLQLRDEVRES
ncbi:MAG: HNH endonuclease [Betaproteobacteria bacterium]|nr:HNH endonuclease [Betaproteobacteria bacterium]